jgi:hypothetical protein
MAHTLPREGPSVHRPARARAPSGVGASLSGPCDVTSERPDGHLAHTGQ